MYLYTQLVALVGSLQLADDEDTDSESAGSHQQEDGRFASSTALLIKVVREFRNIQVHTEFAPRRPHLDASIFC
jgi:hypothetical protein